MSVFDDDNSLINSNFKYPFNRPGHGGCCLPGPDHDYPVKMVKVILLLICYHSAASNFDFLQDCTVRVYSHECKIKDVDQMLTVHSKIPFLFPLPSRAGDFHDPLLMISISLITALFHPAGPIPSALIRCG